MADLVVTRGTLAEVNATPKIDGQLLFTTDQSGNDKIYTDINETTRIQIGGTVTVDTSLNSGSNNAIANSAVTNAFGTSSAFYNKTNNPSLFANVQTMSLLMIKDNNTVEIQYNFVLNEGLTAGVEHLIFSGDSNFRPKYNGIEKILHSINNTQHLTFRFKPNGSITVIIRQGLSPDWMTDHDVTFKL